MENNTIYIHTNRSVIQVVGEFDSGIPIIEDTETENFVEGKGYLDKNDNRVWIYCKEEPLFNDENFPYFWIKNKKYHKTKNLSPDAYEKFTKKNIMDLQLQSIIDDVEKSPDDVTLIDPDILESLGRNSEIYRPTEYAKDDFLKKVIKSVLNDLEIPLSKYKGKVNKQYTLSNIKDALDKNTKMSTKYFNNWAEILGLDMVIIVNSKPDAEDKLSEPLVYVGPRDKMMKLSELDDNVMNLSIKCIDVTPKDNEVEITEG